MSAKHHNEQGIAILTLLGIMLTLSLMVAVLLPVMRISGTKTVDEMRGLQEELDTRNAALIVLAYYSANRDPLDTDANAKVLNSIQNKKILDADITITLPVYPVEAIEEDLGYITNIVGDIIYVYSTVVKPGQKVTEITFKGIGKVKPIIMTDSSGDPTATFAFTTTDTTHFNKANPGDKISQIKVAGAIYTNGKIPDGVEEVKGVFAPVLGSYRIKGDETTDYMYRRYDADANKLEDAYPINHSTRTLHEDRHVTDGAYTRYYPKYKKELPVTDDMIPTPIVIIHARYGYLNSLVNAEDEEDKNLRYLGSYGDTSELRP